VLDLGVVLRDQHRVGGGDERRRGGENHPLGLRADVGQRRGGVRGDERRVVVLARGEDVETDLLGLLRDRDGGLDPLMLGGGAAGGGVGGDVPDAEDSDLHRGLEW